MRTLQIFSRRFDSVPAAASWYLSDLGEARGKQQLFTRQSPQRLKALREHALIESAVSSNRIEGIETDVYRDSFFCCNPTTWGLRWVDTSVWNASSNRTRNDTMKPWSKVHTIGITAESIIDDIAKHNPIDGKQIESFYLKCIEYNHPIRRIDISSD